MYKLFKHALLYFDDVKSFIDISLSAILDTHCSLDIDPSNREKHQFVITNPETLLHWFAVYREKDCFPNILSLNSKAPRFLSENPKVVESINNYCWQNIPTLKIENVHTHKSLEIFHQL